MLGNLQGKGGDSRYLVEELVEIPSAIRSIKSSEEVTTTPGVQAQNTVSRWIILWLTVDRSIGHKL
jgi:hypothetical protein